MARMVVAASDAGCQFVSEINPEVAKAVSGLVTSKDRSRDSIAAFWMHYSRGFSKYLPGESVLVNPPAGLSFESDVSTYCSVFGASYGVSASSGLASLLESVGPWFKSVVAFYDTSADEASSIVSRCTKGTTLWLVFPSKKHEWWLGWAGVSPYENLMKSFTERFELDVVSPARPVGGLEISVTVYAVRDVKASALKRQP